MRLPLALLATVLLLLQLVWAVRASGPLFPHKGKRGRGMFQEHDEALKNDVGKNNTAGKLDIVLTHYAKDTLEETATWWEGFIDIEMVAHVARKGTRARQDLQVRNLKPAVYVYCQNPNITDLSRLQHLLRFGGRLEHLDNLGRESHAFLTHITRYYDQLPDHVLFSQDIPVDFKLWHRFQKMFVPETGFLPLAIVGHQDCEDGWLPKGLMSQLYSMFTKQICPPQGFTVAYNGQFLVSRKRLRDIDWWTYNHLLIKTMIRCGGQGLHMLKSELTSILAANVSAGHGLSSKKLSSQRQNLKRAICGVQELVSAPTSHWIHNAHNDSYYKSPTNPMFGHVVERAWSLAFNCYESWREGNCYGCDHHRGMEGCGTDCCQCMDADTPAIH